MPLPQITTPEFTTTLPSTGERLSFRPFLVKEEKILLMAQEGKDKNEIQRAVINILEECIKTPITVEDLPLFDIEWLFIQLRSKSVGEVIDLKIKHVENKECLHLNPIEVNLEELEMTKDPTHNNIINITDDIGVTMRYPSLKLVGDKNPEGLDSTAVFNLICDCVLNVFDKEQVYNDFTKTEIDKFIGDLDQKQLLKFMDFFKTMPKIEHTIKYKCEKCGQDVEHKLSGLVDFFI
tara:strand:+ start:1032 stop:1739 length:708 start_codon:yes stop_codon:yes gene_type:complete